MVLKKREVVKSKQESFLWTYQEDNPVFLVHVENELQWFDSKGFHVGDPGLNKGCIAEATNTKQELAHILSEMGDMSLEQSVAMVGELAGELEDWSPGTKVFYTYEEGTPVLAEEDDEEIETPAETVEVVEAAVEEVAPPAPEPVVEEIEVKEEPKVSRQTLLLRLRKFNIKVKRGAPDETLVEILSHAEKEEWDLIKAFDIVTSVAGEKSTPDEPTAAEATQLAREVAKQFQEAQAVQTEEASGEPNVMAEETDDTVITVSDLMDKAKGYNWNVTVEEIEENFSGQDLKIITAIYGSKDNEEIAFRLERNFDLSPVQIERLVDGFYYGSVEYPALIELLMTSGVVS